MVLYNTAKLAILGMDCKKDRGFILPGGKFERGLDRTFRDAAAREVEEETGLTILPDDLELIHHALCVDGYYVYFFTTDKYKGSIKETSEGIPRWGGIYDFLGGDGTFISDYDLLFNRRNGICTKKFVILNRLTNPESVVK